MVRRIRLGKTSIAGRGRWFAFAGLVLFFTGLVVTGFYGTFTPISTALCVLGLLVGSVVFLPRLTRNLTLYLNIGLYAAFFIGSLAVLFVTLQRHPVTFDATHQKLYSISDITKNFLQRLDRQVRVTAFMTETERDSASHLLREYARHSPQFSYRIYHPFRDIAEARGYGTVVMPGDVFVELLTTDTKAVERSVKLVKLTEEELTNGIVQLLRGRQVILYFLTGHGELSLESDAAAAALAGRPQRGDDAVWLREQLERNHITVRPLSLGQRNRVPDDAAAVVCLGPRSDLSGAEREALAAYLDAGGRALFLLNPELPQFSMPLRNFRELIEEYSLELPDRMVVLANPKAASADRFAIPAQPVPHRITRMDTPEPLVLTQVRPVAPARLPRNDATIEVLLVSPADTWAMPSEEIAKAIVSRQQLNVSIDAKDLAALPLAAAVTVLQPGQSEEQATRLVVAGNARFIASDVITQPAWLFFLNAVNWLTSSGDLIAIPTANIQNTPLILTAGQKQFLFLLLVIIVPTLVGLAGLGYAITRRELV
ncbi:MAG: GldG family protein [Candidatus Sumerlaeaceae bacterium]|nr:GldG family protein [Candidatus Sumerlaeaceae bacterium]